MTKALSDNIKASEVSQFNFQFKKSSPLDILNTLRKNEIHHAESNEPYTVSLTNDNLLNLDDDIFSGLDMQTVR